MTTASDLARGDDPASDGYALRPARPDDLPICAAIWREALNDYLGRLNEPEVPDDLGPILRLYGHLRSTDPERFVIAERTIGRGSRVLDAFVAAIVRDGLWYLSMLFVRPSAQRRGLGRRLVAAVAPDDAWTPGGGWRATATDSAQPISNGLYASMGIVPRLPLLRLVGRPPGGGDRDRSGTPELPRLPSHVEVATFAEIGADEDGLGSSALAGELGALDRDVLGFERPRDHDFLVREGRHGFLYCDPGGRAIGYGYTSESGRVGPVVVADPALLAPAVAHLVTAVEPRGAFGVWVPGAAGDVIEMLIRAGFRLDDFPVLLCWDRAVTDFARALPISPGLL